MAWREGDEAAGDALVRRHFAAIYRFFRNKASGDLDDLVQDTFMKCVRARDRIRDDASFKPYLFATARNVLRDNYAARSQGRDGFDPLVDSVLDLGMTPTQRIAQRQEHQLLLAALRSISFDDQVALELVYWERLTGKEVAAVFGVPEGTARTRLRSAKQSLEAKLRELARSPEVLASTMDDLEKWSTSIRESLARELGG